MEQFTEHSEIKHLCNIIIVLQVVLGVLTTIIIFVTLFISNEWIKRSKSIDNKITEINNNMDTIAKQLEIDNITITK